jgi:hypothetical protein
MQNWKGGKTWSPGDTVGFCDYYRTSPRLPIFAGLFFYSGFGLGDYFGTDGKVIWTEGGYEKLHALAQADGLSEYTVIDSFNPYARHTTKVKPAPEPILEYVI